MFTGREADILDNGSLKIQYNRNRSYDYTTGRWLQRDPLGYVDGMNLYEYLRSNPILYLDAYGFCTEGQKMHWKRCWVHIGAQVRVEGGASFGKINNVLLDILLTMASYGSPLSEALNAILQSLPSIDEIEWQKARGVWDELYSICHFKCEWNPERFKPTWVFWYQDRYTLHKTTIWWVSIPYPGNDKATRLDEGDRILNHALGCIEPTKQTPGKHDGCVFEKWTD